MTPLILLPGLLHDHRLWTHQAAALADIATISVPDLTQDDHLDAMAMRVLANAPARFALAGLSMGGYVAMAIHRLAPERVERLALLDTTARPDTPEQTERRLEAIRVAKAGGFSKIMPSMLPMLVHPDRLRDEAITGLAKEMAAAVGPDGFERQQTAIIGRPDARPGLSAIHCPALVVVGAQDTLTPPDRAREMADLIPRARLIPIGDCGHLSVIEQPHAINAVLRFWLLD